MIKTIESQCPGNLLYIKILFLVSMTSALPVSGQSFKHELAVTSDNDVYIAFLQDRYYTNGLFFHYRYAPDAAKRKNNSTLEKITTEFELGQRIYNPYFPKAPDPALHDRPFTGYLYGAVVFNRFYKNENMIRVRIEAGTTGKAALGKEVQMTFHKLMGIFKPLGWEYQLKTEPALNLSIDYQNLLLKSNNERADLSFVSAALLGNTFSGANLGTMLRFGKMNPMYQSITNHSLVSSGESKKESREFFLFTSPRINYVAYDATIQGGLFREDKGPITFDAKKIVYSQQLGIGFSAPRWSAGYTVIFRSREVKSSATAYHYASATLAYRFN